MKNFIFLCACGLLAYSIAFMIGCNKKQTEVPGPVKANIDLASWQLQEPPDSTSIPGSVLAGGYHDQYFYDSTDGSKVFYAPIYGYHFEHSNYTRCELKQNSYWQLSGTHTLSATLKVVKVPHKVCVGQIHIGKGTPESTKPLCELYCDSIGNISLGIEDSAIGGRQIGHPLITFALGTLFRYSIKAMYYPDTIPTLTVTINDLIWRFPYNSVFNKYTQFFKAGAYNQSTGSTGNSLVQFYSLIIN